MPVGVQILFVLIIIRSITRGGVRACVVSPDSPFAFNEFRKYALYFTHALGFTCLVVVLLYYIQHIIVCAFVLSCRNLRKSTLTFYDDVSNFQPANSRFGPISSIVG